MKNQLEFTVEKSKSNTWILLQNGRECGVYYKLKDAKIAALNLNIKWYTDSRRLYRYDAQFKNLYISTFQGFEFKEKITPKEWRKMKKENDGWMLEISDL